METWLLLLLMSLATYRLTRLVVEDVFPPVLWVRDRLVGGWRSLTSKEEEIRNWNIAHGQSDVLEELTEIDGVQQRYVRRASWSPNWLADLLSCPFCASGWIAVGVTAGVWASVGLPVPLLVWPAVWALGGLIAAQEWA